jgi:hypothetical protein
MQKPPSSDFYKTMKGIALAVSTFAAATTFATGVQAQQKGSGFCIGNKPGCTPASAQLQSPHKNPFQLNGTVLIGPNGLRTGNPATQIGSGARVSGPVTTQGSNAMTSIGAR